MIETKTVDVCGDKRLTRWRHEGTFRGDANVLNINWVFVRCVHPFVKTLQLLYAQGMYILSYISSISVEKNEETTKTV